MIRPFTLACVLLAAGSGLYLYQAKHRARVLDREIGDVVHATEQARARSAILQAEWQLLNDTERLSGLADRFLSLKPTAPGQFTVLADLAKHLPPIRPVEQRPAVEPDEDAPALPLLADDTPLPPVPPVPTERPVAVAAAASPRPVATPVAASAAAKPVEHAVLERHAAPEPARPVLETRVTTRPAVLSVASVMAPRPDSGRYAAPPMVGSSLGMARTSLPPPMPIGFGGGANRAGNPADNPGGG